MYIDLLINLTFIEIDYLLCLVIFWGVEGATGGVVFDEIFDQNSGQTGVGTTDILWCLVKSLESSILFCNSSQ